MQAPTSVGAQSNSEVVNNAALEPGLGSKFLVRDSNKSDRG